MAPPWLVAKSPSRAGSMRGSRATRACTRLVLPAPDGAETMKAIESTPVDLVVSDIVMPHRNGYEIFAAAQAATSLKADDIPKLLGAIQDDDSAVRYWAAMACSSFGDEAAELAAAVKPLVDDEAEDHTSSA